MSKFSKIFGIEDEGDAPKVDEEERREYLHKIIAEATMDALEMPSEGAPREGFHPSGFDGLCPRKPLLGSVYPREDVISHKLQIIFDVGHSLHALFQTYLGKAGLLIGKWRMPDGSIIEGKRPKGAIEYIERGFSDEEDGVNGHIDGILDTEMGQVIFDLKTISAYGYRSLKEFADAAHIEQVQIYMWKMKIDTAIIFYVEKNSFVGWNNSEPFDWKAFVIDYDKNTPIWARKRMDDWKEAERKAAESESVEDLKKHLNNTPRMCEDVMCKRARYCAYAKECFSHRMFFPNV